MARQRTRSQNLKSIAGAGMIGFGLLILFASLDGATQLLSHPLGATAREALGILPTVFLTAWQALQANVPGHHQHLDCLLQMLVSFWPLLLVVAGAV